jgi:hypothetical protein
VQCRVILPPNSFVVGGLLSWNSYDFGGCRAVVTQQLSQQKQATENELYTEHVTGEVQKDYRQLRQASALTAAAQKATVLRTDELKIRQDALAAGKALPA